MDKAVFQEYMAVTTAAAVCAARPAAPSSMGPPGYGHPIRRNLPAAAPANRSSMPDAPPGYAQPIWGAVAAAVPANNSSMDAPPGYAQPIWGAVAAATPATGSSRPEGPPGYSHPAQPAIAAAAPATGSSMPDAPSGYVLPIWGLVAAAAPATGSSMQDGLSQASVSTCPDGPVGFDADYGYCSSGSAQQWQELQASQAQQTHHMLGAPSCRAPHRKAQSCWRDRPGRLPQPAALVSIWLCRSQQHS